MSKKSDRQDRVVSRLEAQLTSGDKTAKKTNKKVPLTEGDKKRIEKEINTLKKIK
jgi:hypothetical protein